MNVGDWRALIEAYLDGRISAEAFARRFSDAWRINRDRREPVSPAIADLQIHVEAFEAASEETREEGAVNDDEMRQAATQARAQLRGDAPAAPRAFGGRGHESLGGIRVQMSGCAGVGCVIAVIWVALCLLQIFAVSDQIQSVLGWPAVLATVVGLVIAFIPIVGNIIAFFGATDVWGWDVWIAAIVFFAAPAATMLSGWSRWRGARR
jgi:hypothetical protein